MSPTARIALLFAIAVPAGCGESRQQAAKETAATPPPKASKGTPVPPTANASHINVHFGRIEEPVILVVHGKEFGPYRWNPANRIDFMSIAIDPLTRDPPKVSAKILLPCGWEEAKVAERYRYPSGAVAVELGGSFRMRPILVDNRGGSSERFSVGEWHRDVAANEVGSFRIPMPNCATVELKLGSRALGTFSDSTAQDVPTTYLVDPTGRRCYEYSTVHYRRTDDAQPAIGGAPPMRSGRKTLHRIPGLVDHVLEMAPRTIKEWVGLKSATRSQLVETGC